LGDLPSRSSRQPATHLKADHVLPGRMWFKAEFLQRCGVFKTRGAFNRQLAAAKRGELDPRAGIVAASGGNAGLANAYAASALGVPATVFVPETAPQVKVDQAACVRGRCATDRRRVRRRV
jgi:threonine dehydratase